MIVGSTHYGTKLLIQGFVKGSDKSLVVCDVPKLDCRLPIAASDIENFEGIKPRLNEV